jgi:hypothetical protein
MSIRSRFVDNITYIYCLLLLLLVSLVIASTINILHCLTRARPSYFGRYWAANQKVGKLCMCRCAFQKYRCGVMDNGFIQRKRRLPFCPHNFTLSSTRFNTTSFISVEGLFRCPSSSLLPHHQRIDYTKRSTYFSFID